MMGELGDRDLEMFSKQSAPSSHESSSTLKILCSERKEFAVFLELLKLVPSLESCLMSSDEEEVVAIAKLVSGICHQVIYWLIIPIDPERRQRCQGRRHKGNEVHNHRLDHPERSNAHPTYST